MIIHFNRIDITSFKSIGEASIDLNQRGLVTVVGVNNYENNVDSNGSGKSSIFSALFWALFGKTPEGISNPTNRYYNKSCQVSVALNIDSSEYTICRTITASSHTVSIMQDGKEVACRNRTDSDKYIRESILRMSSDLFLSLIYLNQGFSSRLSLLPPAARKERLESLVNTAALVEEFSSRIQKLCSESSDTLRNNESQYNQLYGSRSSYEKMAQDRRLQIEDSMIDSRQFEYRGRIYTHDDVPLLQNKLVSDSDEINQVSAHINKLTTERSSHNNNVRNLNIQLNTLRTSQESVKNTINSASSGECPTCHQKIDSCISAELVAEAEHRLKDISEELANTTSSIEQCTELITLLDDQITKESSKLSEIRSRYQMHKYVLENIPDVKIINVAELSAEIEKCENACKEIDVQMNELQVEISKCEHEIAVLTHCRQLVTKSFRNYLLQNAIKFLNNRLKYYSSMLFSNNADVVSVSADSQKLDIMLGTASYDSLSGGEQRRVDIPLMLAQKDLAAEVAGISSNILILDEILESMDEKATQVTLQLLEQQSKNVESMFIISHNQYSLPVDSTIVVEKDANRVAHVREN